MLVKKYPPKRLLNIFYIDGEAYQTEIGLLGGINTEIEY